MSDAFTPSAAALLLALAIDLIFGEPPARLHPVVWMGRFAQWIVRAAPAHGKVRQLVWGVLVVVLVGGASAGAALLVRAALDTSTLSVVVEALVLTTLFAVRALGEAVNRLGVCLAQGRLDDARTALGHLCSRDPSELAAHELAAGAIESGSENACDSIVAPLFYYVLFGLPAVAAYRAVNTLDATIGYRGRFEYLGKAAARLDDLLNLVPARLTAALLVAAGLLRGARARDAVRAVRRDAGKTQSPNAGHPMAAMAGLLGVTLTKPGQYTLCEGARAPTPDDVARAWRIVALATWLAFGLAGAICWERVHAAL